MSLHLLQSEYEDKTHIKHCMAHEDHGHSGFACVVGKNQTTSKLSPMADDAITEGGEEVWDLWWGYICAEYTSSIIMILNLSYRDPVNNNPLTPPNVDKATDTGMIQAIGPNSFWPKVCGRDNKICFKVNNCNISCYQQRQDGRERGSNTFQ